MRAAHAAVPAQFRKEFVKECGEESANGAQDARERSVYESESRGEKAKAERGYVNVGKSVFQKQVFPRACRDAPVIIG